LPLLPIAILALVQGITEFLPISSSGHLILFRDVFAWSGIETASETPRQQLIIDVAVHVGTLFAVLLYFRRDVLQMALGGLHLLMGRGNSGGRLLALVILGTLPLVVVGWWAKNGLALQLRSTEVIAWTTLIFGVLLFLADKISMTIRRMEQMTVTTVLIIGVAQILALIPGVSRSGITMTAARALGFERTEAARFSLLLSIPAILGAGTLAGLDLYKAADVRFTSLAVIAAILAFAAALAAIAVMMRWLRHATFTPFAIYRVVLGGVLLYWIYGG
jgi:undecaprenyl-diphosphatase